MKVTAKGFLAVAGLLAMSVPIGIRAQQEATVSDKDVKVVDVEELRYPQIARVAHIEGVVVIRTNSTIRAQSQRPPRFPAPTFWRAIA